LAGFLATVFLAGLLAAAFFFAAFPPAFFFVLATDALVFFAFPAEALVFFVFFPAARALVDRPAAFFAAFLPPLRLTVSLARVATTNSFTGFSKIWKRTCA
jgi:hypothetical protein